LFLTCLGLSLRILWTKDIHIVTCLSEGRRHYATLLSLLGNRSNSMDRLTTPVLLRCMVTNSRKASVSIVAVSVKKGKTIHRVSPRLSAFGVSLSLRRSVSEVSLRQLVSGIRRVQCSQ
jgi:hypothetical protein